jgi:hypothetical protein
MPVWICCALVGSSSVRLPLFEYRSWLGSTPRRKDKIEVDVFIAVWLVQCLICAIFSAIIGAEKGRSGGGYFICGLLFGVFGLIFAAGFSSDLPQTHCAEMANDRGKMGCIGF